MPYARKGAPVRRQLRRRDLRVPSNLEALFRELRNHLAGNASGITRDETLARQLIHLLFCKIHDELHTRPGDIVEFRVDAGELASAVARRVRALFGEVKSRYSDVFDPDDALELDSEAVCHVVAALEPYAVTEARRDALGNAFQTFLGPALRGAEGQFFTPRNVVDMVIDILDPRPGESVIDPACGSGGFLVAALMRVWSHIDAAAAREGWPANQIARRKSAALAGIRGLDKDAFLARVARAYLTLHRAGRGQGRAAVFCENSLARPDTWQDSTRGQVALGSFDVVVTNPPFGQKIRVRGEAMLAQYDLGHRLPRSDSEGGKARRAPLAGGQVPQLLFLERCIQLLRPGGRLGIVLPESVLGNPSYAPVVAWLRDAVTLTGVVTLPEALFKTSGKGGTHAKVCVLFADKPGPSQRASRRASGHAGQRVKDAIFLADARWCGHDSRGNPTIRRGDDGSAILLDDVPLVARQYHGLVRDPSRRPSRLGFLLARSAITGGILVPKYYDPELAARLAELASTHELVAVGELEARGILAISTGVEVGKMAYGSGPYPFIRTSDIANWELKSDPKHGVSEAVFLAHASKATVLPGDILVVRDGTYLVGTSAMVTRHDGEALFQSHLYRLRVLAPKQLDRYLFFAALNTPIVRQQVRAKQFTQDIIDTLGTRIREIVVPLPRDVEIRRELARRTRTVIETRARLRREAREIVAKVAGAASAGDDLSSL